MLPVGEKYVNDNSTPTQNPVHILQTNISPQKMLLFLTYSLRGLNIFDIVTIVVIPKETKIQHNKFILNARG
jgi:hypothetical protein